MSRLRSGDIAGMDEAAIREKVAELRSNLARFRVDSLKGTLRKDSGKIRPMRRNVARLLTRLNEVQRR